jgi:hypothetical protein
VSATPIEEFWPGLDPKTQEWLKANPGSVMLPRSVTAAIRRATGDLQETDRHGRYELSPDDRAFIRSMAALAPVGRPVSPADAASPPG